MSAQAGFGLSVDEQLGLGKPLDMENSQDYGRLIDAQRARQQAVYDAMLMQNRISRLKLEEEKALKRINETRTRAEEIMRLKERDEQRKLEKQRLREEEEAARREAAAKNRQVKAELQQSIRTKRIALQQEKFSAVQNVRQMREANRELVEQMKSADAERITRCAAAVREHERSVQYRKQLEGGEAGISEYERKLQREDAVRQKAEEDLIAMEREEAELIARLKKAQEAQANAFSELEHALMTEVRVSPKRATKTGSVLSPR